MRLTICALSAVLLSGCSWLGMGGNSSHYSYESGANCGQSYGGYNQGAYGFQASAAAQGYGTQGYGGCGVGGAYGVGQGGVYGQGGYQGAFGHAGYDQAGYGQAGFGQAGYSQGGYTSGAFTQNGMGQAGYGQTGYGQSGFGTTGFDAGGYGAGIGAGLAANGVGGAYGATGYGATSYASNTYGTTTLGANAPYGGAVYGAGQYAGGQFMSGANVQNIQGSAIYVPQPYPAYYGVSQLRGAYGAYQGGGSYHGGYEYGGSSALPFGFEVGAGASFDVGGDIFTSKEAGPALGAPAVNTGGSEGIAYKDAFGEAKSIGGALTYDMSRNTTLLGSVNYATAKGQTVSNYQTVDARGAFEGLDAEFSDLDVWTIEGGVRQYIGQSLALRPYVAATAGFSHNNDVTMNRTYSDDGAAYDATPLEYVEAGWNPTASAVIGAEMAVGSRAAIGVESGVRWTDNMKTIFPSEDRWSVPVKLRGRVSF